LINIPNFGFPFSILERIVVVETVLTGHADHCDARLSVSSNGSWWLKRRRNTSSASLSFPLSVSSNGSWWLKLALRAVEDYVFWPFSILERIVVVETAGRWWCSSRYLPPFSILERIVVVETPSLLK